MRKLLTRARLGALCARKRNWLALCTGYRKKLSVLLGLIITGGFTALTNSSSILSWLAITPSDIAQAIHPTRPSFEDVIHSAMIESMEYAAPSSEMLVVKVLARANLKTPEPFYGQNLFLFTLVSPFRPSRMDTFFRGDGCRLLGQGVGLEEQKAEGYIDIIGLSCVDDRGVAYELHADSLHLRRLGFVSNANNLAKISVALVRDGESMTLRQSEDVMVRFDRPIEILAETGRVP